jgi:hypothetical protein
VNDSTNAGRGGAGAAAFAFGGGGGLGGPAPYVMPGNYTVALTSGGKALDSKTLKVVFDPDVHFGAGEHERYTAMANDLHALQRRAVPVASALNALYPQMTSAAKAVAGKSDLPANVKSQFDALNKSFDDVRKKFGVPLPAPNAGGRGGGGGGGRGNAPDPENVLARTTALKTQLMGVWESPSAAMLRQYNGVKTELPKAIAEANAVFARASAVSQALQKAGITLTVPPAPK